MTLPSRLHRSLNSASSGAAKRVAHLRISGKNSVRCWVPEKRLAPRPGAWQSQSKPELLHIIVEEDKQTKTVANSLPFACSTTDEN